MKLKKPHQKVSEADLAFMSSLSQAALEKPTFKSQILVWVILVVIIWLIIWANHAELDKIVRGEGKVVPSTKIQLVQNLEGGIVENIFVTAGDHVNKDQILIKLDNIQYASSFGESKMQQFDLSAQAARLSAIAYNKRFKIPQQLEPDALQLYQREQELYQNQVKQQNTTLKILREKINQNESELNEAYSQRKQLQRSYELLQKEIRILHPLVKEGIASEVDLLKTEREANDAFSKLETTKNSIPKLKSVLAESKATLREANQKFRNDAQKELNEVLAKLGQLENSQTAIADKVRRTNIVAPVSGIISELLVGTIGEVVQPGSDMVKIVPEDDALVLETKIIPSDIGFIYPGLTAKVKFTAYDFAIYGGLDGTVEKISADTIQDEEGNSFYIARIKTQKNYLGTDDKPLELLPGMTATVDIVVGKHTVLDYLLKPIIKAKDLALRES